MKFTPKQLADLECIKWFTPKTFTGETVYPCGAIEDPEGEDPRRVFLDRSDRGIRFEGRKVTDLKQLERLIQGKRWRGITIHELWEPDIPQGIISLAELVKDMPEVVKDYVKKELFSGKYSKNLDMLWQRTQMKT